MKSHGQGPKYKRRDRAVKIHRNALKKILEKFEKNNKLEKNHLSWILFEKQKAKDFLELCKKEADYLEKKSKGEYHSKKEIVETIRFWTKRKKNA